MQADQDLLNIACTFQRVLSGHPAPGDLEYCRALTAVRSVVLSVQNPGESQADGFDRIVKHLQNMESMQFLTRAGGEYFNAAGRCRSLKHARAFIDSFSSKLDRSRLGPKALFCGLAQPEGGWWEGITYHHYPNRRVWALQLIRHGELEVTWREQTVRCRAGDIIVVPPQASLQYRVAPGSSKFEEFWFHFQGTSRWLQWLDWIPRLSAPAISRDADPDRELADLSARIVALNGSANKLQQHLQEVMFEELLIRQRLRQGPHTSERSSEYVEGAKRYIMDTLFEPLSLGAIARHCGLSSSHLSEVFKANTGSSPMQWRERERLHRAGELLYNSKLQVMEVASLAGYSDYRHFSRRFKAVTGLTPSSYRQALLREQSDA